MYYEYLFPELLEEAEPDFYEITEDISMPTKGTYCPRPCPPYKCVTPSRPRYCRPKYPSPCPPPCPPPCPSPCPPPCLPPCPTPRPQCPRPCYPLYPLPQWPRPCYPSYPCQRYPPQWLYPRPLPCGPQRPYCQLPCPPSWGRQCYPKYLPQYPCDFLEIY